MEVQLSYAMELYNWQKLQNHFIQIHRLRNKKPKLKMIKIHLLIAIHLLSDQIRIQVCILIYSIWNYKIMRSGLCLYLCNNKIILIF